jgi:hypothetical protein
MMLRVDLVGGGCAAPDLTDPESRCQWFYFSVRGAVPGLAYKFNVVNLGKKDSLYNAGMRPLVRVPNMTHSV